MSKHSLQHPTHSPYRFISQAKLPTIYGEFDIHVFENDEGQEHVMLTCGLPCSSKNKVTEDTVTKSTVAQDTASCQNHCQQAPLVRIHSECLTGDAFSSLKCDCGPQLNATMRAIQKEGYGAILYLRQEGRGIGLTNKIRAYALQDQGHDTLDANLLLGLPADARTYEMCKPMLDHVGITKLRLLTNNPNKLNYLEELGFEVVERIPLVVGLNPLNAKYLNTKRDRMGHQLNDFQLSDSLLSNPQLSNSQLSNSQSNNSELSGSSLNNSELNDSQLSDTLLNATFSPAKD